MKANAARDQREVRAALTKVGEISRWAEEDGGWGLGSVCLWGEFVQAKPARDAAAGFADEMRPAGRILRIVFKTLQGVEYDVKA